MEKKEISDIQATLLGLRRELENVTMDRDRLTVRAIQIEQNIKNLEGLLFREAISEKHKQFTAIGVTEAIKTVLRTAGKPMTAADTKLGLQLMGFDLKGRFKNPSAAVHSTLKRLASTGELIHENKNKTYTLRPPWHPLYGEADLSPTRELAFMLTETPAFAKNLAKVTSPRRAVKK